MCRHRLKSQQPAKQATLSGHALCFIGNFFAFWSLLLSVVLFLKLTLKNLLFILESQMIWIQIRTNIQSVVELFASICYQQMIKVTASKERVRKN